MWTGVIVLLVVVILATVAWWFQSPRPKKSEYSPGGPGIQPGRDYSID